jgi:hypothetical protein
VVVRDDQAAVLDHEPGAGRDPVVAPRRARRNPPPARARVDPHDAALRALEHLAHRRAARGGRGARGGLRLVVVADVEGQEEARHDDGRHQAGDHCHERRAHA